RPALLPPAPRAAAGGIPRGRAGAGGVPAVSRHSHGGLVGSKRGRSSRRGARLACLGEGPSQARTISHDRPGAALDMMIIGAVSAHTPVGLTAVQTGFLA